MTPKYPEVDVNLSGEDGNVFSIIGRVRGELRRAGVQSSELDEFFEEVMESSSYDDALQTVMKWVSVS